MHSMLLLQLEDALVIQVLLRLDRYSLCVFSRSCRECFRLSTDNQLWYTHTLTQLAPQHRARPPPAAAAPGYWRSVYCCWHGAAFRAPVAQLHGTRQRMISAVCIDNSSRCWVGDDAGSLQLWDLTRAPEGGTALSSDAVTVIHGHKAGVNCVSLSCEPGWSVISGGADRALRGWDNRTNAVAFELEDAMHDEIFCIQACQNQIAVGGADVDTKLYDARKMHSGPVGIFEGASDTVYALCFDSRQLLFTCGADKQLNKFNMVSGEWLATGYGHQRDVHGVWLVDDQVLTVGMDGFCKVWDVDGGMWLPDHMAWTEEYFEAKRHINCGSGINAGVTCGEHYILTAKRCGLIELYDWHKAAATDADGQTQGEPDKKIAANNLRESLLYQWDNHITCIDARLDLIVACSVNGALLTCVMGAE